MTEENFWLMKSERDYYWDLKESIFFTQTLLKLLKTKKQTDIAFGSK